MKSKRRFDVMKEVLCENFRDYVFSFSEDELYHFLETIQSLGVINTLSENCKPIKMPEEILQCEKCEKIYGNCDSEIKKMKDATLVCKKRFYSYCETPLQK